jgi:alpha-D-xyloside xylohydrolase
VWSLALAPDGRPIARAFGLAHPELGVHPSDEYFFGDDLLVAPVVEVGATTRHVILPDGAWIDWWDATPYGGGAADVAAPIDRLPLLMRDGAIIPMLRPTIDTLAPADDPEVESFARDPGALWVRIAPGQSRRVVLWDGTIVERVAPSTFDVTGGAVFTSGFVLELVGQPMPNAVDGGTFLWKPDARGTLVVTVPASKTTTRVIIR